MNAKWLKKLKNGKFSNILKDDIETKEAQLETHSNSEIKTISDQKKQVSKNAMVKNISSLI